MPPVVFEEIDTEIANESRSEPQAPAAPQATSPNPAEFADRLRRELALIEARRMRLSAD